MSKEVLTYYCNTVWPIYVLHCGERWPMDGSLDYWTTMQLEQHCQQLHKWDEICYVKAFMSLHNRVSPETEVHLKVQRREGALKLPPHSKAREEKESKEKNFINALNPGDSG